MTVIRLQTRNTWNKQTHRKSWWSCFIIFVMWNDEVCVCVCVFHVVTGRVRPVYPGRWGLTCVWNGRGSVTSVSVPASSQQPWWNVIWSLPLKLKCCLVILLSGKLLIVDFSLPLVFICVLSKWLHLSVLSLCPRWYASYLWFLLRERHYYYCLYLGLVI